jgi:predicted TIM-barrel fold metal-dependent hydrolase
MPSRNLPFPVFDADNHFYETQEALTKHLPDRYRDAIAYVEVRGRTRVAVLGQISEYIPNPTFEVVARPGALEEFNLHGNPEGRARRQLYGAPMRSVPAFFEPAARLALMDEQGLDRTLLFPTLATFLEEKTRSDPDLLHAAVHALNQWIHETWTFNYRDRIFPTPVITLAIVEKAVAELEWALERGARAVFLRAAPVPGYRGSRSFGLAEFDPFWAKAAEAGVLIAMHASDSGYERYVNDWEGIDMEYRMSSENPFRAVVAATHRPILDSMAALVCHGAFSRFPALKVAPVENGSIWVRDLFRALSEVYTKTPQAFSEEPIAAFKRNVYLNPLWNDDIASVIELMGADHVMFGSDFPHPEGLADPISYAKYLEGLPEDIVRKIMGDNLARLLGMPAASKVAAAA